MIEAIVIWLSIILLFPIIIVVTLSILKTSLLIVLLVAIFFMEDTKELIQAAKDHDPAAKRSIEVLVTYQGIHAIILHRLAHKLSKHLSLISRMVSNYNRWITGIEIHPDAEIGKKIFIDHGMGIVIGETAIIGQNCHLYQGVTLGGTSTKREKRHPTLKNNVTIGAGAKLIGNITIGENAKVGAGAVVISNVPDNATVVGVPAHIVAFFQDDNETIEKLPDPGWDRINELERQIKEIQEKIDK